MRVGIEGEMMEWMVCGYWRGVVIRLFFIYIVRWLGASYELIPCFSALPVFLGFLVDDVQLIDMKVSEMSAFSYIRHGK